MKNYYLHIIIFLITTQFAYSQEVDNIKIERSGDIINIRYQILKSKSDQVFKVKILCSIDGGVNREFGSMTGDVGDVVVGGKTEYVVFWDVLKDVDEVKSVEFTVRAELSVNISASPVFQKNLSETAWDKKRFHSFMSLGFPGAKIGYAVGYIGNWGIYLSVVKGKTTKASDADKNATLLNDPKFPVISGVITKRILNKDDIQLHIALGVANSKFIFYNKTNTNSFSNDILVGPELGLVIDMKGVAGMVTYSTFDPTPVEDGSNWKCWSVLNFVNLGVGIRF
jgi:hypothetical protein